jgi:hypothetical protein
MTEELLEKAQKLRSGFVQASDFLERLNLVDNQSGCCVRFDKDEHFIFLPKELAEHVINEIIDYYKEKKDRCAKEFRDL